ncbi:MAG: hypothetical protein O7C75_03905 [Verrucomicrobia bacterium]|nr:hypothetical protein [Verrucomicrobiota bacterium]
MLELVGHVFDSIVHMLGKSDSVSPYIRRTKCEGVADNQLAVLGILKRPQPYGLTITILSDPSAVAFKSQALEKLYKSNNWNPENSLRKTAGLVVFTRFGHTCGAPFSLRNVFILNPMNSANLSNAYSEYLSLPLKLII